MNTDTITKNRWEILPKFMQVWAAIPVMWVDALIVFLVAMLTTMATAFTSEEAYKYVNPFVLFWTKICVGSFASGLVALQSFRNRIYAEHMQRKAQQ
jgi:hypothetical protein